MSETTEGAGFATLAIHAGAPLGPESASLGQASLRQAFDDPHACPCNPACAALEDRIATLEGGTAAVAVTSGAAARLLVFHTLLQPGDELVAARRQGYGEHDPLDDAFQRFGWQVRWADADKPETFVEALSDRTKAVLIESMAEPGGLPTDIEAVATIARRARVPLVVDNTLATPYLVRPFEHGADIVLHVAMSLLGGQASARGGLVVDGGSFSFASDDRYPALSQPLASRGGLVVAETYGNFAFAMGARLIALRDFGGAPSPLDAVRVADGIETLALRMQRHCDNALAVARHLERHSKVAWVRYAGLERGAGHALVQRYCPKGAGAGLTFAIGGADATPAAVRRLRLFSAAAELGGTRSLVIRTASAPQDAVRLSIGLEDVSDIIADLEQALAG